LIQKCDSCGSETQVFKVEIKKLEGRIVKRFCFLCREAKLDVLHEPEINNIDIIRHISRVGNMILDNLNPFSRMVQFKRNRERYEKQT